MTRFITGAVAILLPCLAQAQGLERQVFARQDGTVRLSYASRPGVCGGSNGNITMSDGDDERDGWTSDCEEGPVRVAITLNDGIITQLTTRVGGRWLPKERGHRPGHGVGTGGFATHAGHCP